MTVCIAARIVKYLRGQYQLRHLITLVVIAMFTAHLMACMWAFSQSYAPLAAEEVSRMRL
jgi:hypothetical protein